MDGPEESTNLLSKRQKVFLKKLIQLCEKTEYQVEHMDVRCNQSKELDIEGVSVNGDDAEVVAFVDDKLIQKSGD